MNTQTTAQPIRFLVGKELYLWSVLEEDLPKCVVWINDPKIREFVSIHLPQSPQDEKE